MPQTIPFTKMHGLGNDYIYVNTTRHPIANPSEASIRWSDHHTGRGGDGERQAQSQCEDQGEDLGKLFHCFHVPFIVRFFSLK